MMESKVFDASAVIDRVCVVKFVSFSACKEWIVQDIVGLNQHLCIAFQRGVSVEITTVLYRTVLYVFKWQWSKQTCDAILGNWRGEFGKLANFFNNLAATLTVVISLSSVQVNDSFVLTQREPLWILHIPIWINLQYYRWAKQSRHLHLLLVNGTPLLPLM